MDVGDISGRWSHKMTFTPVDSENKRDLFDVQNSSAVAVKTVAPEAEQEPNESRR